MYLDQRGWLVLNAIVNDPSVTGKELESMLQLSRKQLGYSIEKINDYLAENNLPKIERLRTGKFRIPSPVIEQYQSADAQRTRTTAYTYSDKERGYLILLMLLCSEEELSTWHFTTELNISKNTLILDLKKLQDLISAHDVNVYYSRKDGYTLLGSEYAKRELLIMAVRKVLEMPEGRQKLCRIGKIEEEELDGMREEIGRIEKKLHIQFTDERMSELPYILVLTLLRIRNEHYLTELPEAFQHVVGTKEYAAVVTFANKYEITEQLEKLFLTAQIQISNMSSFDTALGDVEKKLVEAAKQVIRNFELICCIKVKERDQLLEALIQHWKPAYYRIKYNYHIETSITDMILPQHNYLHGIVKKAIHPLEKILGGELPDEELVYITLLFGGWLKREGLLDFVEERKRAIVVCANGVSVSNFLFMTLRELFPEMEFLTWLSVREFQDYQEDYNIVFTTERLETDKIQFLVTPFLNEYSRQKFREKVFQELGGVNPGTIRVTQLLDIIEQHTTVHTREQLIRSLERYINAAEEQHYAAEQISAETADERNSLPQLLNEQTVMVLHDVTDWKQAIETGVRPFLLNGQFERRYVDRMIEIIEKEQPYVMVAEGVVIAHAGVKDGVNRLGMGLVKLPKRIMVGGYMDADVIVILGTPDNTVHLGALYQLNEILEDERKREALHAAETVPQIIELINYSDDVV